MRAPFSSSIGTAMTLEEEAISLLLRSPRLDVTTILNLLDVGDLEFREIVRRNPRIAELLEERRRGALTPVESEPVQCASCREWFVPYAGSRFCSDPCRDIGRVERRSRWWRFLRRPTNPG
jgi:hypothetical protein